MSTVPYPRRQSYDPRRQSEGTAPLAAAGSLALGRKCEIVDKYVKGVLPETANESPADLAKAVATWTQMQMNDALANAWKSDEAPSWGKYDSLGTTKSTECDDGSNGSPSQSQNQSDSDSDSNSDSNSDSDGFADSDDDGDEDMPHLKNANVQSRRGSEANERILYDKCTIRTWFMAMDKNGDGHITKKEFVKWLIDHPALRKMLVKETDEEGELCNPSKPMVAQAVLQRRMIKFFNEIDVDRNKRLEWKEFLALFRRAGYLLEYSLQNNPRDNAAKLLKEKVGTGPLDAGRESQRARRGSECLWVLQQQSRTAAMRRNSFSCNASDLNDLEKSGPAALWEKDPVVLGMTPGRRRSWGGTSSRRMSGVSATMPCF